MYTHDITLILVGLSIGTIGTLIGAGGGFLLVPFLLLVEQIHSKLAVGISLAVVFFNALSGTIAYMRQKRIDYRSGCYFLLSSIPGAIIGTSLTGLFKGEVFKFIFGGLLLLVVFRMLKPIIFPKRNSTNPSDIEAAVAMEAKLTVRKLIDETGHEYHYSFSIKYGIILSFFVGIYSGLFGVGGGILHVPIMIGILGFPTHIASATSHFILVFTSLASTIENITNGNIDYRIVGLLSTGIIIGAQVGAYLSNRVNEKWLKIILAFFLVTTALKMMFF
ncbi:MAG TPA: sulfite exporter TauE/SafE family protein [Bacillota bacterium]|nr:sulfite exporter TauE/SafE family protein [Bacillota bacterium]